MRHLYLFQLQLTVIVRSVLFSVISAVTVGGMLILPANAEPGRTEPGTSYTWQYIPKATVPNRTLLHQYHLNHLRHLAHLAHLAYLKQMAAANVIYSDTQAPVTTSYAHTKTAAAPTKINTSTSGCYDPSGQLSYAQVAMVWECAGGPAWAVGSAETISMCESGHNTNAYNPSGATGLFQILGSVVSGNLYDAHVNALNAVSKFTASGDTWSQWVCQA